MPESMGLSLLDHGPLAALLETLLPGDAEWPGATALELADSVKARVGMAAGHEEAIARLLNALPAEFEAANGDAREDMLREHEGSDDFAAALLVAYDAYYVHEDVLNLLESRCDYVTRPPQPAGFELAPFDESRLAQARQRAEFWRKT